MPLTINTNLSSMGAQRNAGRWHNELSTAVARLSSGLRINTARDDAAGLAIAERFTAQIRGTHQAARNANDAISLSQTAESSLADVSMQLQRIRELAVQAANASNSATDRAALQAEVAQRQAEIDRVAVHATFNGSKLLDGSFAGQSFHVGANADAFVAVPAIASMRPSALGTFRGTSFSTNTSGHSNTPAALSVTIGGVVHALGSVAGDSSARVAAINASGIPGLTATALASIAAGTASSASGMSSSGTATVQINGVNIAIEGGAGAAALPGNRLSAVQAINAQSGTTGVVATDAGASGGVTLTAADGRNINVAYSPGTFTGSSNADFGLPPNGIANFNSGLRISYTAPAGVTGFLQILHAGYWSATVSIAQSGTPLSSISVSTAASATTALASVDLALATVGSTRATLGALQNRLASAVSTLHGAGESLSVSRSRIEDADFAQETANLSRAQVLQSAGTAMIAQANQLPGQVLALLR